jgi:serine/threonine protein kinase
MTTGSALASAPVSARDPNLGKRVGGRFLLERALGAGGVGKVYEALQEDLGRKVAVKLVRSELATEPEVLERFRREARAVAALAHPHIAQVLDFGEPKGREPAFIAFELVRGTSLAELLHHEGRFTAERTVRLAQQVLAGLAAAHQAGIVHRDLKPGNIFVASIAGVGEMAKLLDFGIAQVHDGQAYKRITATGATVGTPRYMSPEQLTGKLVDARSDLWSLGVVMYRMLVGAPPFDGAPGDILMAIHGAPVPPMPASAAVPPALEAVVMRALEKDPDRRWRSAAAMAAALESVLADEPRAAPGLATFDDVTDRVTSPGHAVLPDGAPPGDEASLPIVRTSAHPTLGSARPPARTAPMSPLEPRPVPAMGPTTAPDDATLLPRVPTRSGTIWALIAGSVCIAALVAIPWLSGTAPDPSEDAAPDPPHSTRPDDTVADDEREAAPSSPLPLRGTLGSYVARAGAQASGVIDLSVPGSSLALDFVGGDGGCQRYTAGPGVEEALAVSETCGLALPVADVDPTRIVAAGEDACGHRWGDVLSLSMQPEAAVVRVSVRDRGVVAFTATLAPSGAVHVARDSCSGRRRPRPDPSPEPAAEGPMPDLFRRVDEEPSASDEGAPINDPWH